MADPYIRTDAPDEYDQMIVFQMREDRKVYLQGHWPEKTRLFESMLDQVDKKLVWQEGGFICFNVANGGARYLITGKQEGSLLLERKVFSKRAVKDGKGGE